MGLFCLRWESVFGYKGRADRFTCVEKINLSSLLIFDLWQVSIFKDTGNKEFKK